MAIIRLGTWAKSDRNTIHPAINSSVTFPLFVQSVIVLLVKKRSSRYLEYSFLYLDSRFSKAKKTTPNIIFVCVALFLSSSRISCMKHTQLI